MRVVGTLNNTRPSRQLSPKDSQVVYSFGFSYENFLFKSETELKLEMDKDLDETTQHGVNENILNKVKLFFTFFEEGVQKET